MTAPVHPHAAPDYEAELARDFDADTRAIEQREASRTFGDTSSAAESGRRSWEAGAPNTVAGPPATASDDAAPSSEAPLPQQIGDIARFLRAHADVIPEQPQRLAALRLAYDLEDLWCRPLPPRA